jgi:hypothetical protein
VGSRKESGPPDTYSTLTGQPAPSNKQPLVAYLGSVDAVKFGGCLWGADAGDNGPVDIVGVTTDVPVVVGVYLIDH